MKRRTRHEAIARGHRRRPTSGLLRQLGARRLSRGALALLLCAGVVVALSRSGSSAGQRGLAAHSSVGAAGPSYAGASLATALPASSSLASASPAGKEPPSGNPIVGRDSRHDLSPPLRSIPPVASSGPPLREANPNPSLPSNHVDGPDPVVQRTLSPPKIPPPILNFDGIPFPGVACNCAPPDTNGEVGATQYVQIVNEGYQVFNKTTGASVFGPVGTATIWSGFGGVCETNGDGDAVVLYDQLANRWLVSQFAGAGVPTDECIAVSTSSDATGTYNRYDFHLGTNFFDYPKLGVWPDAYYMSMNVFNSAGTAFLGPQPFAFDRAAMLAGTSATFVSTGITVGPNEDTYLPADLDGSTLPPAGAPESFVEWPGSGSYRIFHFHVDFAVPANSTFTLFASPPAAAFTQLCPTTRACVPQAGSANNLDGIGDRLMFRLAYRNFGGHESLVGNFSVSSGGVAGIRWFELRGVTSGPATVFQDSTYQPDTTWRWLGSAAMDASGDLAVGFSASDATISPQLRYAGRLAGDPPNTLAQGEAHLFDGTGSQIGTGNRWGDYSDLTIDPQDDCTFWYTNEYAATTGSFNWRTRIGNFKFTNCAAGPPQPVVGITKVADAALVAPGSQIGFTVTLSNVGGAAATGLTETDDLPAGTGINWTLDAPGSDSGWSVTGSPPNQHLVYSPTTLAAGASTHAHVVSGSTTASCSPYSNTASFTTANDGNGSASASERVGTSRVALSENFDGVTAPALPAGWTATNAIGPAPLWVTTTTAPDTAPNSAFVDDPATVSDKLLDSPSIAITTASAQLSFRNNFALEAGFDGGLLEIKIGAGAFQDITAAGGSFASGGYTGTISTMFGSPIPGRQAWTGSSGGYETTLVNLPAAAAGQSIQLRFRMGSDSSISRLGWHVDTIKLTDGFDCSPTAVRLSSFSARPLARGNLLRWRTAQEASLLGFNVYRSGVKLNRRLIVARGAVSGAGYRLVDRTGRVGAAYTYWLQAVQVDGRRGWIGRAAVTRR